MMRKSCQQTMTLDKMLCLLTFGEVAAARSGRSPPHAVTRLSASCDIICVTFTTNTWLSDAFTKSITVFVLCLKYTSTEFQFCMSRSDCIQ